MLDTIFSMVLKLLYSIMHDYIIYDWREFNICFISEIKIFFQHSEIQRIISIQELNLTTI